MGGEIPVGQLIGYARVSTAGQDVALQRDALERAGCARVYADTGADRSATALSLFRAWSICAWGTRWWFGGWIVGSIDEEFDRDG